MKLIWNILANIYSHLVVDGFVKAKPPAFLFHQPKVRLPCLLQQLVLVDKTFNEKERKLIHDAVDNLEQFSNGLIRIFLKFDLDPDDEYRVYHHNVILRASSDHPTIDESDETTSAYTLGLCQLMPNNTRKIYLAVDRMQSDVVLRTTMLHELGHFAGMWHTDRESIMFKQISPRVLYMTSKDAEELAKVWRMRPEDFRYFHYS